MKSAEPGRLNPPGICSSSALLLLFYHFGHIVEAALIVCMTAVKTPFHHLLDDQII